MTGTINLDTLYDDLDTLLAHPGVLDIAARPEDDGARVVARARMIRVARALNDGGRDDDVNEEYLRGQAELIADLTCLEGEDTANSKEDIAHLILNP